MCVPYSFAVTKEGEIFFGRNMSHHTDICAENGLEYDRVLKPEYQIWNRELKDVTLSSYEGADATIQRAFFGSDGFLRNRFAEKVNSHVAERFPDWKAGLSFIEQNWDIVKEYVPQLTPNMQNLKGNYDELIEKFMQDVDDNFDQYIKIKTHKGQNFNYELRLEFNAPKWGHIRSGRKLIISGTEMMKTNFSRALPVQDGATSGNVTNLAEAYLKQRIKWEKETMLRDLHYKAMNGQVMLDQDYDAKDFVKHWSKKENRVLCWQN